MDRRQLLLIAGLFEGGLGAVACLLGWLFGNPPWESWLWQTADVALGIAVSLPMLVLFALCLLWPWRPLASLQRVTDEVIRPLFQPCTVVDLAIISLLAGLGEEMFFRGLLQPVLVSFCDPWLGIALASLVFGLMHPITASYAVLATLVGLYLGWVFHWTENLLVVVIAHGLYDFIALWFLARVPSLPGRHQVDSPTISENGKSE